MTIKIHPTANVEDNVNIGEGTYIWHQCQIRSGVSIGTNCILGKGVYIDKDITIGNNIKIQNYVSVFHGVKIENGVFIGPHVCFTNDLRPRAVNPDGSLKNPDDWIVRPTTIKEGASIGANSTILCGIVIGEWAMIGAGSVVTKDVPSYGLVYGNPAKLRGFVCKCGEQIYKVSEDNQNVIMKCEKCGNYYNIPIREYNMLKK